MTNDKYLPIGTVVLLKNAKKRLMIIGFCAIPDDSQNKVFDYCGCLYPEGLLKSDQIALFNHDEIDKIYDYGFVDVEETEVKKNLNNERLKVQNG